MKVGDTAYIVESNRYVREVEIRRCSGGMFLVRFTDTGGGIQVKAHRLFATREEAEKSIEKALTMIKVLQRREDFMRPFRIKCITQFMDIQLQS
jgi:hypothetical protein